MMCSLFKNSWLNARSVSNILWAPESSSERRRRSVRSNKNDQDTPARLFAASMDRHLLDDELASGEADALVRYTFAGFYNLIESGLWKQFLNR